MSAGTESRNIVSEPPDANVKPEAVVPVTPVAGEGSEAVPAATPAVGAEPEAVPAVTPAAGAALMARRFRGFLPVVVDIETGGFNSDTDALLEIAAVLIDMDGDGVLSRGITHNFHVRPFEGARLDPASLSVTGIDPFHPLRPALPERDALQRIFREIRHAVRSYDCRRAILVGHNAAFDLGFLNAAVKRDRKSVV